MKFEDLLAAVPDIGDKTAREMTIARMASASGAADERARWRDRGALPENATEPMQRAMQRAVILRKSMNDVWRAALAEAGDAKCLPLTDGQALVLARKHLDKGLSWAPHITRCNDLEIRALIRAVEAAHGIRDA